jgi:hypothetical protein
MLGGEDPGGLGRGRRPLPTGEVEKVVGEERELLLSRGLAEARREGKRDKERKKRKGGQRTNDETLGAFWMRFERLRPRRYVDCTENRHDRHC